MKMTRNEALRYINTAIELLTKAQQNIWDSEWNKADNNLGEALEYTACANVGFVDSRRS